MRHFRANKPVERRCVSQFCWKIAAEDVEVDSYGGQWFVCCHYVHSHGHTPMSGFKDTKDSWIMVSKGSKDKRNQLALRKLTMES